MRWFALTTLAALWAGCQGCPPPPPPADPQPAPSPAVVAPAKPPSRPTVAPAPAAPGPGPAEQLIEEFGGDTLDPERWQTTRLNDFQEARWDLGPDPGQQGDGRLRLRAATLDTRDATVKHMGLVMTRPLDLRASAEVELDLDWAHQRNGSYLALALYLAPSFTRKSASKGDDWLAVRVVGEPPGRTARVELLRRSSGNLAALERFGWPKRKPGWDMGPVRLGVRLDGGALRLSIDGKERFSTANAGLRFEQAHVFVELTSHSNYAAREVFVDRVAVRGTFAERPPEAAPLPGSRPPAVRQAPSAPKPAPGKPAAREPVAPGR